MNRRQSKEKEIYDEGKLKRESLDSVLQHVKRGPSMKDKYREIKSTLHGYQGGDFLEIGSKSWGKWIYDNSINFGSLKCINISEREVKKGRSAAKKKGVDIDFSIDDATSLSFEDNMFDVVYGGSIIHHLDIQEALTEIKRVVKPGGIVMFSEPLGLNPIAMLVRSATPRARTPDEKPLFPSDIKAFNKYFDVKLNFYQLFEVPACIVSKYFFEEPVNRLTRIGRSVDTVILNIPYAGYFYRTVLIKGYA